MQSHLQQYIPLLWEVNGRADAKEIILPQGVVEIVFSFADEISGILPHRQSSEKVSCCFIQGMHTHIVHSQCKGIHHLFGIHLHPHRIQELLGILPSELNNITVDLTLINPFFNRLWHQLSEATSFEERVKIAERELPVLDNNHNQRSEQITRLFRQNGTNAFQTVDELAKQVYYSPRQLNRVTHQLFGFSADELTVYKKFIESVKLIHTENNALTSVAYEAGFYDQAHFCRVFKSYTGITPNQYKKQKSHLPFHLYPTA